MTIVAGCRLLTYDAAKRCQARLCHPVHPLCPAFWWPMAVEFAAIERDFEELRSFILNDIRQIVALEQGANYAAAAIIACAHETLAQLHLRGSRKYATFAETLPTAWRAVAPSLFDALRNGIAHGYATKTIVVAGSRVEIGVSWRERQHLSFDPIGELLYLNVQQLAKDLEAAFARVCENAPDGGRLTRSLPERTTCIAGGPSSRSRGSGLAWFSFGQPA